MSQAVARGRAGRLGRYAKKLLLLVFNTTLATRRIICIPERFWRWRY